MKRPSKRNTVYLGFSDALEHAKRGDVDAARWLSESAAEGLRSGTLPGEHAAWLADRLVELADGADPSKVLLLRRGKGRPRRHDTADRDVDVYRHVDDARESVGLERAYGDAAEKFCLSRAHVKAIYLRFRSAQVEAWNDQPED
jgi:hypothetical protein